jgi:hypothetical protein
MSSPVQPFSGGPAVKSEPDLDEDPKGTKGKQQKRKANADAPQESPSEKSKAASDADRKTGTWSKAEDKIL